MCNETCDAFYCPFRTKKPLKLLSRSTQLDTTKVGCRALTYGYQFFLRTDFRRSLFWRNLDQDISIHELHPCISDSLMVWIGIAVGCRTDLHIFRHDTLSAVRCRDDILAHCVRPFLPLWILILFLWTIMSEFTGLEWSAITLTNLKQCFLWNGH